MKTCGRCRQSLSVSEFYRNRSAADGLQFACKACVKAYAANPNQERKNRMKREFDSAGVLVARECSRCREVKPTQDFAVNRKSKDGLQGACRECSKVYGRKRVDVPEVGARYRAYYRQRYQERSDEMREAAREYRLANPETVAKTSRKSLLKKKYGLTLEEFDELLAGQDGRCAICLVDVEKPHVDHDHVTGKVRALLCSCCNTAIGQMQDNAAVMRRAADYVDFWAIAHEEVSCV